MFKQLVKVYVASDDPFKIYEIKLNIIYQVYDFVNNDCNFNIFIYFGIDAHDCN